MERVCSSILSMLIPFKEAVSSFAFRMSFEEILNPDIRAPNQSTHFKALSLIVHTRHGEKE